MPLKNPKWTLTLCHTILLTTSKKKSFWESLLKLKIHCRTGNNIGNQHFLPFLECVPLFQIEKKIHLVYILTNCRQMPSTLSQTTNFRIFQTERICRRQSQIWWKQKVLQKDRKHCEKRWNCSLWAISPFPTVFSKDLYSRHVKSRACLG